MVEPAYASASVRNSKPILGVLHDELGACSRLLEVGSGTGYHAVTFGRALPALTWQTSDLQENHEHISAAIRESGLANVSQPIVLDVLEADDVRFSGACFDAVYSSNTAHIMGFDAVRGMIEFAGRVLRPGGVFLLYGPFKRAGHFSTPSNAAFDNSLRARNGAMGIRDLEAVDRLASRESMQREKVYAMPANNLLIVWRKRERGE